MSLSFSYERMELGLDTIDGSNRIVFSWYWQCFTDSATLIGWWEDNLTQIRSGGISAASVDMDYFYEGVHGMAGKKDKSSTFSAGNWKGFANINLREQDKAALQGIAPEPDEILACIDAVISSGHKISITRGEGKKACVVSFTGQEASGANNGYTLSSFASNFFTAFTVNYYKHHYMAQGNWSQFTGDDSEDFG